MNRTLGAALLTLAACQDTQVSVTNRSPTASIVAPIAGAALPEGRRIHLEGVAGDADDALGDLRATWRADGVELCPAAPPTDDGSAACDAAIPLTTRVIALEVRDPKGASATDERAVTVIPDAPPTATMLRPTADAAFSTDDVVVIEARVADAEDPADALAVRVLSDQQGVLAEPTPTRRGDVSASTSLQAGTHLLAVEVTDTLGHVGRASVVVTVEPPDAPPTCAITAPADGSRVVAGQAIALAGVVDDAEDAPADLQVAWSSDLDGPLGVSIAGADGAVTLGVTPTPGDHQITLTVTDSAGRACADTARVVVDAPPTLLLLSPADGSVITHGLPVGVTARVDDREDAEPSLSVTLTSDLDGLLATPSPQGDGTVQVALAALSPGLHTLTLAVRDSAGSRADARAQVRVDRPPGQPGLTLLPEAPRTDDALVATLFPATDADGDPVTHAVRWTRDDVDAGVSALRVDPSLTRRGERWTVIATPADPWLQGAAATASVLIRNTPPALDGASVAPGSATRGVPLTCLPTGARDADGDPVNVLIAWEIDGVVRATGEVLPGDAFVRGEAIVCAATPTDDADAGLTVRSAPVVADDAPPSIAAAQILPDPPRHGDAVTCVWSGFTDADGDPDRSRARWSVDGAPVAAPGELRRGTRLGCEVTPSDGSRDGAPISVTTVVANTPPTAQSVALSPPAPQVGDALSCALVGWSDVDGDPDRSTIRWTIDGQDAGSGPTLAALPTRGQRVVCTGTPHDGFDPGPAVQAAVVVGNTAPVALTAEVTPRAPTVGDPLRCVATGDDADGDAVTFEVRWEQGGALVGAGDVLPAGTARRGEGVRCVVTPSDGLLRGEALASAEVTVGNTPPAIGAVVIDPDPPRALDTVRCGYAPFADADGDPDRSTIAWQVEGRSAGAGPILQARPTRGDRITCAVTPSDGFVTLPPVTATTVVVNSAPSVERATITPEAPALTDPLTCAAVGFRDADGDADQSQIRWERNGAQAGTGRTLAGPHARGDLVRCVLTPWDGLEPGTAVAAEILVGNTPPRVLTVRIDPPAPTTADALSCLAPASDPDGDLVQVALAWQIGADVVGWGATLPAGVAARGDAVSCVATPNDGHVDGPGMAAAVVVRDSPPTIDAVSIVPDPPRALDAARCAWSGWSDADGDPDGTRVAWWVDGVPFGTDPVLPPLPRGTALRCDATPHDGELDGPPRSASAVVANTPPDAGGVWITPERPRFGEPLSCAVVGFADADGDPDLSVITWTADGQPAGEGSTIAGTWPRGTRITCQAALHDGWEAGPTYDGVVAVLNSPPELAGAHIEPATPVTTDLLRCVPDGADDADGDPVAFEVVWQVDGVVVDTIDALPAGIATRGQTVTCTLTPTDRGDRGTPATSAPVVIGNSAPAIATLRLAPNPPRAVDTVTCVAVGFTDADGDPDRSIVTWEIDGQPAGTGATLAAPIVRGQSLRCTVTPFDGLDAGEPRWTTVTVANSPPTALAAVISPDEPDRTDALSCAQVGFVDADGDPDLSRVRWTRGGVGAGDEAALDASLTRGDDVTCTWTPSDGIDDGPPVSDAVRVRNAPPRIVSATLGPEPLLTDSVAVLTVSFADPDGDAVTARAAWTVDGLPAGDAALTLSGDTFSKHQLVAAVLTPTDGLDDGPTWSVPGLLVANAEPRGVGARITPQQPVPRDTLVCAPDPAAVDPDGDAVRYVATWSGPQGAVAGADGAWPGDTVPGRLVTAGDWTCTVTAVDDEGLAGPPATDVVTVRGLWPGQVVPLAGADLEIWADQTSTHLGEGSCPLAVADVDGDGVDDLVLGVSEFNQPGANDAGGVRIFLGRNLVRGSAQPMSRADIRVDGDQAVSDAGYCVANAGDLDGDGRDEILVGAPRYDTPTANAGRVWLFLGSQLEPGVIGVASAHRAWSGALAGDAAGWGLAGGRDVDGGGVPDLIIGAPQQTTSGAGRAYLLRGEALPASGLLSAAAAWTWTNVQSADRSGEQVALADVDGDGHADVIVGAPQLDVGGSNTGAVWIASGADTRLTGGASSLSSARWRVTSPSAFDLLGQRIDAGDVDGDGLDDLLLGAPAAASADPGAAWVIAGASLPGAGDLSVALADHTITGVAADDQAGSGAAVVPDLSGDGLPEIVVGAPFRDVPANNTGDAALFSSQQLFAAPAWLFSDADTLLRGESDADRAGRHVAAGDLDGDGAGDVIVAAPYEASSMVTGGRVYVIFAP